MRISDWGNPQSEIHNRRTLNRIYGIHCGSHSQSEIRNRQSEITMAIPLKYNLRSALVRRTGTLMAVLSVSATVAVFVSVMALARGLEAAFTATGHPLNLVVIRQGAQVETNSSVEREKLQTLKYLQGTAKDELGAPLVSAETQVLVFLPRSGGERAHVLMRGVSSAGLRLRPQVHMVEGRLFKPGLREVISSRALARRFAFELGQPLRLDGGRPWYVVGIFDGSRSAYDSEIWADVNARASMPVKILGSFIAVIMSIGACFAAMNAMYASVAYRVREIGTLRVLGFRRFEVLLSFLVESVLLAIVGGIVGCALALPIHGISTGTLNFNTFTELAFFFRITPGMLAAGIGFAALMGALGGLLPALLAARRTIIHSLRA